MFAAIAIALYTTNPWVVLGGGFAAGIAVAVAGSQAVKLVRRAQLSGAPNG